jgi:hypothetical protein
LTHVLSVHEWSIIQKERKTHEEEATVIQRAAENPRWPQTPAR